MIELQPAVVEGAIDRISAFTPDGRMTAYDLRVPENDRGTIPPNDAIIVVSARLVRGRPHVLAGPSRASAWGSGRSPGQQ
jgi:glycine betaine/choline ABC-type transport system substrate-binding protein